MIVKVEGGGGGGGGGGGYTIKRDRELEGGMGEERVGR